MKHHRKIMKKDGFNGEIGHLGRFCSKSGGLTWFHRFTDTITVQNDSISTSGTCRPWEIGFHVISLVCTCVSVFVEWVRPFDHDEQSVDQFEKWARERNHHWEFVGKFNGPSHDEFPGCWHVHQGNRRPDQNAWGNDWAIKLPAQLQNVERADVNQTEAKESKNPGASEKPWRPCEISELSVQVAFKYLWVALVSVWISWTEVLTEQEWRKKQKFPHVCCFSLFL